MVDVLAGGKQGRIDHVDGRVNVIAGLQHLFHQIQYPLAVLSRSFPGAGAVREHYRHPAFFGFHHGIIVPGDRLVLFHCLGKSRHGQKSRLLLQHKALGLRLHHIGSTCGRAEPPVQQYGNHVRRVLHGHLASLRPHGQHHCLPAVLPGQIAGIFHLDPLLRQSLSQHTFLLTLHRAKGQHLAGCLRHDLCHFVQMPADDLSALPQSPLGQYRLSVVRIRRKFLVIASGQLMKAVRIAQQSALAQIRYLSCLQLLFLPFPFQHVKSTPFCCPKNPAGPLAAVHIIELTYSVFCQKQVPVPLKFSDKKSGKLLLPPVIAFSCFYLSCLKRISSSYTRPSFSLATFSMYPLV